MLILENIINSIQSILSNKLRSTLSMLWIIIWVSSVIILNSLWAWSQQTILNNLNSFWANNITITAWWVWWNVYSKNSSTKAFNIKLRDYLKNKLWSENKVTWFVNWRFQIIYKWENMSSSVYGIDENYFEVNNLELEKWFNIAIDNIELMDKVIVIWSEVSSSLFKLEDPIWKKLKVWNSVYFVIGTVKSTWWRNDSNSYIPLSTAQIRMLWDKSLSQIVVVAKDPSSVNNLQQQLTGMLNAYFNVINPDTVPYSIENRSDFVDRVNTVTTTITLFLSWIAAISLIVWWIWVMNIMLVSVTERTKEIWIRKAIWAQKSHILIQFLMESSILSIIWWGLWILFSLFVIWIVEMIWLSVLVELKSILIAFWFSGLIWVIFGLLPAYKASNLRPIEALRFE